MTVNEIFKATMNLKNEFSDPEVLKKFKDQGNFSIELDVLKRIAHGTYSVKKYLEDSEDNRLHPETIG